MDRSCKTNNSSTSPVKRVQGTSAYREAPSDWHRVKVLRDAGVPFEIIADELQIPATTCKRWAERSAPPGDVGRPAMLSESEESALRNAILQRAVARKPMTTQGLTQAVSSSRWFYSPMKFCL